jgi:hypothetical protein
MDPGLETTDGSLWRAVCPRKKFTVLNFDIIYNTDHPGKNSVFKGPLAKFKNSETSESVEGVKRKQQIK